jgi:hypothetical protein
MAANRFSTSHTIHRSFKFFFYDSLISLEDLKSDFYCYSHKYSKILFFASVIISCSNKMNLRFIGSINQSGLIWCIWVFFPQVCQERYKDALFLEFCPKRLRTQTPTSDCLGTDTLLYHISIIFNCFKIFDSTF